MNAFSDKTSIRLLQSLRFVSFSNILNVIPSMSRFNWCPSLLFSASSIFIFRKLNENSLDILLQKLLDIFTYSSLSNTKKCQLKLNIRLSDTSIDLRLFVILSGTRSGGGSKVKSDDRKLKTANCLGNVASDKYSGLSS